MKIFFYFILLSLNAICYGQTDDSLKKVVYSNASVAQRLTAASRLAELSRKKGLAEVQMNALNEAGGICEHTGNYRNALKFYRAAQDIRDSITTIQKARDSTSVKYNMDLLGDVFGKMGQRGNNEQALLNNIETKRALDDTLAMAIDYMNLGIIYEIQKQFPKAKDALQQCLQYAQKIAYTDLQNSALAELSNVYQQTGDFGLALNYFKKHQQLAQILAKENSSTKIAELQTKYENTQKENRILQQQFEISRRNYWVAGIAIVLVLSLLLYYSYYKRSQLRQQNIATNAIIETEEKERKRIAQDLHDSVSQIMMAAKINLTVIENEMPFKSDDQKNRFTKAINLVDEGFREVRTISHNMMPQALLESGLAVVVRQFLRNIETSEVKFNFFSRGFEDHFDANTETILYRVLQECVNNVLKHAKASRVDISLIKDEQNISLTIEDNGAGFTVPDKSNYKGLGLKNMQNRINFLKGRLEFDSKPGNGTLVSIYIPLR